MKISLRILVALCLLVACAATPAWSDDSRTITDMVGRTVRVHAKSQRLVTTFKPSSLCVASLGLMDRLVGIDTDSKRDALQRAIRPDLGKVPAVGRKSTGLNLEAILSLKPDLVIMYAQKDGVEVADRLVQHGVPAIIILPEKFETLYGTLRLIADAVGEPERAERAIAASDRLLKLVQDRVGGMAQAERKTVYFCAGRGLFNTATGDLLQDEIITKAGCNHAGHELTGYFREISPETFLQWRPDVVTISSHGFRSAKDSLHRPEFAQVPAIRDNAIYLFPSSIAPWDFPSILSSAGVLWLAKRVYPEHMADVDLMAEVDRYHETLFGKSFTALGGELAEKPE